MKCPKCQAVELEPVDNYFAYHCSKCKKHWLREEIIKLEETQNEKQ
jgi:transposase-like protein